MSTVTLAYTIPLGRRSAAIILAQLLAVPIFFGELELLGFAVQSDFVTPNLATRTATRTVVLADTPQSQSLFPTPEAKTFATAGLYAESIAYGMSAPVDIALPVVT
jgi:hypothetical protein